MFPGKFFRIFWGWVEKFFGSYCSGCIYTSTILDRKENERKKRQQQQNQQQTNEINISKNCINCQHENDANILIKLIRLMEVTGRHALINIIFEK